MGVLLVFYRSHYHSSRRFVFIRVGSSSLVVHHLRCQDAVTASRSSFSFSGDGAPPPPPSRFFFAPNIRENSDAFFDVVKGSNKVGRGGEPLPYGWNCSKGWDPATGLGTPLLKKLMAAAMGPDGN